MIIAFIKNSLLFFIFLFSCVQQEKSSSRNSIGVRKVQTYTKRNITIPKEKVLPKRPIINPSKLKITKLDVNLLDIGVNTYPKIRFKRSEMSDYAEYSLCEHNKECGEKKTTVNLDVTLSQKVDGPFTVMVSACVYKERSTEANINCGANKKVSAMLEKGALNKELHELLLANEELEDEIREEGITLLKVINKYELDILECKKKHPDIQASLSPTVINNLKKLGPKFVGESLLSLNDKNDEENKQENKPHEKIAPDRTNINNALFGVMGITASVLVIASAHLSINQEAIYTYEAPKKIQGTPSNSKNKFKLQKWGKLYTGVAALGALAGIAMIGIAIHDATQYGLVEGESIDPRCPANHQVVEDLKKIGKRVKKVDDKKKENDLKIDDMANKQNTDE